MKKLVHTLIVAGVFAFSAILFSGCGISQYVSSYDYSSYNPTWAPPYYAGARYYYFPDIESYYDISRRDFVILRNGQWIFVKSISPYYPTFNLNTSYIVVLNSQVYDPWMHYQYYIAHYPRYYYRDYYDYSNIPYVRGFNENNHSAFYWDEKNRDKARDWNGRNLNDNRRFTYSSNDKKVQDETTRRNQDNQGRSSNTNNQNNGSDRGTTRNNNNNNSRDNGTASNQNNGSNRGTAQNNNNTRNENTNNANNNRNDNSNVERSQDTNYYGRPIGRPVKVVRQMRETNTQRSSSTTNESSSRSRTNTNTNSTETRGGRR